METENTPLNLNEPRTKSALTEPIPCGPPEVPHLTGPFLSALSEKPALNQTIFPNGPHEISH